MDYKLDMHNDRSGQLTYHPTRFYNNPNNTSASNGARKALDQIFDKYRTNPKESPNELDIEGTGRLLEDLGIELDNCAALYFFEFTKSPQLGVITREGFTSGPLVDAGCDTPDKIRKHIYDQLITNNGTLEQYKAVYNHTFTLLIEDRKKAIDLEQAEAFWRILTDSNVGQPWTPKNGTDFLPMWLEFLNSKWQKAVNRDLWRQTLSFMLKAVEDESLSFWTEESSWPSVNDDFVLWVKVEKRGEAMEE